ncbi:hypothetical protein ACFQX6_01125 [Streptosporangium lutulentum]
MVAHVINAERAYARKIGVRHKPFRDAAGLAAIRAEITEVLAIPSDGSPLVSGAGPPATPPGASPGTSSTISGRWRTAVFDVLPGFENRGFQHPAFQPGLSVRGSPAGQPRSLPALDVR